MCVCIGDTAVSPARPHRSIDTQFVPHEGRSSVNLDRLPPSRAVSLTKRWRCGRRALCVASAWSSGAEIATERVTTAAARARVKAYDVNATADEWSRMTTHCGADEWGRYAAAAVAERRQQAGAQVGLSPMACSCILPGENLCSCKLKAELLENRHCSCELTQGRAALSVQLQSLWVACSCNLLSGKSLLQL